MRAIAYTIGHSNKTLQQFLYKLSEYEIETVIDVRTRPQSRWCPYFNRRNLEAVLPQIGVHYLFRGHNLGGLLENVDYDKAIDEVVELARTRRIVLMCSEGDYKKCHRFTMLTPDLLQNNLEIEHIIW